MAVRLFVGNLPYDVTEAELRAHFAAIGPLSYLSLATDRDTGKPRGFAFVEFSARADAEDAIRRLHNQAFKGARGTRLRQRVPRARRPRRTRAPTLAGTSALMRRRGAGVRPRSGPRLLSAARSAPCTSARPDRCVSALETTTVTRRRCAAHTGRVTAQTRPSTTPYSGLTAGRECGMNH
jgi:RNA recognition motif. (a.k.a. RRM, RBD, or RNP domain)